MRSLFVRWYPLLLALIAAGASLAVYARLPEQMPIHFDLQGNPNGWAPRPIGAFLPPALILVLWGVLTVAPRLDPRRANYERFAGAYATTVAAALFLLFVTHFVVLALVLGYPVPLQRVLPMMVGVLFLVIGNVLPRARSNFMYGIRTPWTLSNERVWARTHRLGGYTMALAGIAMIAAGAFAPAAFTTRALVIALVVALGIPVVFSYFAWRQERQP